MKKDWDVIVVGAGAAGLYAAATAAARNRKTLLIEKNKKLGVKILMSGGTRCNITHDTNWQGIVDAFGKRQGRFLRFALASLPPEQVVNNFNTWGVSTKVEETGKVFPESNKAIDVRDALVSQARTNGVQIERESAVVSLTKTETGFHLQTSETEFNCQSVILTTGGQSYPGCGTTGDGYGWLKQMGHSIEATRPALTPIRVADQWARELSGVTITDVKVRVRLENKKGKQEREDCRGSFLFTHKGCSGPTAMNVSRVVTDPANNVAKTLVCDWNPDCNEDTIRISLASESARKSGKQIGNLLSQLVPKRLAMAICELADVAFEKPLAELSKKQANKIIGRVKQCELRIDGTLGYAKAEVTAGGVTLNEVDSKTMQSKIVPHLFLAGEILDVDGPIGGYNFQAAFSTGFVAGRNA